MSSPDTIHFFTGITWDHKQPKYAILMSSIKQGILHQMLKDWLPSSRKLAEVCGINRNTVVKALEELVWEGWLIAFPKKGLRVNHAMTTVEEAKRKTYNIPFKLRKNHLNNFPVSGIPVDVLQYQILKSKFLQQHIGELNPKKLLQEWLQYKCNLHISPHDILFAQSVFECNYILSRLLLENNDAIIASKPVKNSLVSHIPNLDIRLVNLPLYKQQLQIEKLKQIFETNKNIKFLYLHNILDDLQFDHLSIINLMELCYRYGVLIIENIILCKDNLLKKVNMCKYYDYKHFVITCIHNQLLDVEQYSYVLGHSSILEQFANFQNNIQSSVCPHAISYHLQYLLAPQQLKKITK